MHKIILVSIICNMFFTIKKTDLKSGVAGFDCLRTRPVHDSYVRDSIWNEWFSAENHIFLLYIAPVIPTAVKHLHLVAGVLFAATPRWHRLRVFTLWNDCIFSTITLFHFLSCKDKPVHCRQRRPCFIGLGVSTDLSNLFSRFPRSKRKAELEYPSKMAAIKEEREVEDYKRKGRRSSQVRAFTFLIMIK